MQRICDIVREEGYRFYFYSSQQLSMIIIENLKWFIKILNSNPNITNSVPAGIWIHNLLLLSNGVLTILEKRMNLLEALHTSVNISKSHELHIWKFEKFKAIRAWTAIADTSRTRPKVCKNVIRPGVISTRASSFKRQGTKKKNTFSIVTISKSHSNAKLRHSHSPPPHNKSIYSGGTGHLFLFSFFVLVLLWSPYSLCSKGRCSDSRCLNKDLRSF